MRLSILLLLPVLGLVLCAEERVFACNTERRNQCRDRFWHENYAEQARIRALESERAQTPVLILQKRDELARFLSTSAVLVERTYHLNHLKNSQESELQFLVDLEARMLPARSRAQALPRLVERLLPDIVSYLRRYIRSREVQILGRIQWLEEQIRRSSGGQVQQAFRFELARMREIAQISGHFRTAEERERVIRAVVEDPNALRGLTVSAETLALLRWATEADGEAMTQSISIEDLIRTMDEVSERLRLRRLSVADAYQETIGLIRNTETEKQQVDAGIAAAQAEISRLEARLSAQIDADIAAANMRINDNNMFWACCDNEPFCSEGDETYVNRVRSERDRLKAFLKDRWVEGDFCKDAHFYFRDIDFRP